MPLYPAAAYRPVANHGGPMRGHLGLVLHVQVGSGSLYGYFNNPASQVSAHFWCSKTGHIEQYLDTNVEAWAEMAGNPDYLSVETEGLPTEALTPQQVAAVAALLRWCAETHGFPITGPVAHGQEGFTPHCNPDGTPDPAWGDHPCPESLRLAQMPAIVAAAKPAPPPPPPPPPVTSIIQANPEEEDMPVIENTGDTRHIYVWDEAAKQLNHWWQSISGTPNFDWHHEVLPMGNI